MDVDPETYAQCDHGIWDVMWCGVVYEGKVEAILECHYCHVTARNAPPEHSLEDYWATYWEEQR